MITQFSGDMFRDDSSSSNLSPQKKVIDTQKGNHSNMFVFSVSNFNSNCR
jgi:hypothetical protein